MKPKKPPPNLNKQTIRNADGAAKALENFSIICKSQQVEVIFRDLEDELVKRIQRADVVLGCVAWLTSEKILKALAKKDGVSIIVQKEDFLRPDSISSTAWKRKLQNLYQKIPAGMSRASEGLEKTVLTHMSYLIFGQYMEPIRCVGNHNTAKDPAFPRMHNKFLIFCNNLETSYGPYDSRNHNFSPYEVWTGSFNCSNNATNSFENAVIIKDEAITSAFLKEYAQIAALSEPLDWKTDWMAPEWRIGS